MNRHDPLERELTAWFVETAMPRRPDYANDIVRLTASLPQRRWTSPERWLPMSVVEFRRRTAPRFPWRTVAVLVALFALLVAGLVLYAGSQERLPPPFGLARNGLVAYSKDGDIFTVDPSTGSRRFVTSGDEADNLPRWSPDGTRLAFVRGTVPADLEGALPPRRVVIVDQERNVIAESVPIEEIDPDAFAWSPDGRYIAVGGSDLFLVDAADGALRPLDVAYHGLDVYWRPGHPSELLFRGETGAGVGLVVVDVNDPRSARLVAADGDEPLRPNGWTVDGRRIIYTDQDPGDYGSSSARLRVLDLATQAVVDIDAGHAHVSNDGARLLAIGRDGRPCIASIDGGPCTSIADAEKAYDGTYAGGAQWAPDDGSILISSFGTRALLDPAGNGTGAAPSWMAEGAESWQRVAR